MSAPYYRPDIDGLRAIAVLAVIGFHAFPALVPGGFVGVDIFFVISGYLISTIILTAVNAGRFSVATFYARRIRRIFPALIAVLAACYAAGWFLLYSEAFEQLGKHIAGGAGFVANYVLWNEAGYFDADADTKPLLHDRRPLNNRFAGMALKGRIASSGRTWARVATRPARHRDEPVLGTQLRPGWPRSESGSRVGRSHAEATLRQLVDAQVRFARRRAV